MCFNIRCNIRRKICGQLQQAKKRFLNMKILFTTVSIRLAFVCTDAKLLHIFDFTIGYETRKVDQVAEKNIKVLETYLYCSILCIL